MLLYENSSPENQITPLKLVLHCAIFLTICLTTLTKKIHCKLQETCYTLQSWAAMFSKKQPLQSRAAACNGFKKISVLFEKVKPSSTACVIRCNFPYNLSRNVDKRNSLQVAGETCYTLQSRPAMFKKKPLQSRAAACNEFKKFSAIVEKVRPSSTASVIRCNFLCNSCCNDVARQVAGRLQRLTCPLCNLSRSFFGRTAIAQSKARFYFLQRLNGLF